MPRIVLPNPIEVLLLAVNRLDLPPETRAKLPALVPDLPPKLGHLRIVDVLTDPDHLKKVIGHEDLTHIHLRVGLYALVYFPGQWIPDHIFMGWKDGQKYTEDSPVVVAHRKSQKKYTEQALDELSLYCVNLIRQNSTAKSTTVSGYRLTCSASDYLKMVNKKDEKVLQRRLAKYEKNLGDDRILPEHLSDELERAELTERKALVRELTTNEKLKGLLGPKKSGGDGSPPLAAE